MIQKNWEIFVFYSRILVNASSNHWLLFKKNVLRKKRERKVWKTYSCQWQCTLHQYFSKNCMIIHTSKYICIVVIKRKFQVKSIWKIHVDMYLFFYTNIQWNKMVLNFVSLPHLIIFKCLNYLYQLENDCNRNIEWKIWTRITLRQLKYVTMCFVKWIQRKNLEKS